MKHHVLRVLLRLRRAGVISMRRRGIYTQIYVRDSRAMPIITTMLEDAGYAFDDYAGQISVIRVRNIQWWWKRIYYRVTCFVQMVNHQER